MRRYRTESPAAISDINIANLVDVVLVLLIIFMISAPLLQSGIEVDLPKTRASAISEEAEGVVVTIDKKGGIYINDVWSRLDNFEQALTDEERAQFAALPDDEKVRYLLNKGRAKIADRPFAYRYMPWGSDVQIVDENVTKPQDDRGFLSKLFDLR